MTDVDLIRIEVAYALPHQQKIIELLVVPGTTALQAVEQSGITEYFSDVDIATASMGIFGQLLGTKGLEPAASHILKQGDRVEIYRALIFDPKDTRRKRAKKYTESIRRS